MDLVHTALSVFDHTIYRISVLGSPISRNINKIYNLILLSSKLDSLNNNLIKDNINLEVY